MCFNRCTIARVTRNISASLVVFGLLSLLGACATSTPIASGSSDLEHWIEQEGAAYVIDQLQNDPRFAGASVQLAHLDGELITPDVSILSDDVRRQLFSAVLRVQGIDLAVRPAVQPWQAQRTLASVDCGLLKPVTHVVGLELRATASGHQRLSLRALDMRDNAWVSGFESTWAGQLTQAQAVALRVPATDPSLRGLRQLPFDGSQADLTASYLARNLSCLLQQGAPERLKLHFTQVRGAPDYFKSVGRLLGRYMNQYREVDVVSDPSAANAVVNSDVVQLGDDLWQVWTGVAFTDAGRQVSGADTPAYVWLDSTAGSIRSDLLQMASTGAQLTVTTNQQQYALGEHSLKVTVDVPAQGYVNVVTVDPNDKAVVLFPNRFNTDNRVEPGALTLPTPQMRFELEAQGPVGEHLIVAFWTAHEMNLSTDGMAVRNEGGEITDLFAELSDYSTTRFRPVARENGNQSSAGWLTVEMVD